MGKYFVVQITSSYDMEVQSSHEELSMARKRAKKRQETTGVTHDVVKFMGKK